MSATTPSPTISQDASIELQIQVFIFYTISSIGVAYFIGRLIKSICTPNVEEVASPVQGQKIIFWTSFITICLFFFRSILIWCGMLYHLASEDDNDHQNFAISISFLGYGLGLWLMLLTFAVRIDYTFRGSWFAYSVNTIRILYGLVFMLLLFTLVLIGFVVAEDFDTVGGWLLPLILVLHFLFSGLITYLLLRKVFVLMRHKVAQSENDGDDQPNDKGMIVELNNIDSFTRFALLMFIGVISTYLFSIINNLTLLLEDQHPVKQLGVGYSLIAGDLLVNSLVIYLLFPVNTEQYNLCCKYCHGCCRKCCIDLVYRNMKKDNATNKNKEEFMQLILS